MLDLVELVPPSWQQHLWPCHHLLTSIGKELDAFEKAGARILPDANQIFRVLQLPPEAIRVVIVGQDPYPNPLHAIGRAFAVPMATPRLPASLGNIFKERRSDVGGPDPSPDLSQWEKEGVMLLNSILTVTEGNSNSHRGLGWERVTEKIVEVAANAGAAGILWGNQAASLKSCFSEKVIIGVHPSPLSAHRGFFGSRPFSRVNDLLEEPITW